MTVLSKVPITELEVVNKMLRAIKEEPVSSLILPVTPDAETAINIFSDFNREFQSDGWHFNYDYNVTLTRDSSDEIVLGTNIMSAYTPSRDIAVRGQKLYDRRNRTFVFIQDITDACTVTLLEFEDLPAEARHYIAIACARLMQEEIFTDVTAERINIKEEERAWASFLNDEAERSNANMGTGNIDMFNTIHRYRGRNTSWLR